MTRSWVILAAIGALAAAALALILLRHRPDPRAEVAAAFVQYQTSLAGRDAAGVRAVTSPRSVAYFGDYLREHALRRTREQMEMRSIWEQYCILVYRDVLGAPFLRASSPEEVYAELVRQHLLLYEVEGLTLGPIAIDKTSAEAPLLLDGQPSGRSILFDLSGGRWTVVVESNVRYAISELHEAQARGSVDKPEFVRQVFQRFRGKPLPESLWDPPEP